MDFLERDLEDIVFEYRDKLEEKGMRPLLKNPLRQFRLPGGGIIDIFSFEITDEGVFKCQIIELKKSILNENAFWQILSYYVDLHSLLQGGNVDFEIEAILIGKKPAMDEKLGQLMIAGVNIKMYHFSYDWDGLFFYDLITISDRDICREVYGASKCDCFIERLQQINSRAKEKETSKAAETV